MIRERRLPSRLSLVSRERVEGMLLGCAVGDALGLPVETLNPQQIREIYGRVTKYESPAKNPFLNGQITRSGSTSDDYQLTEAVAFALVRGSHLNDRALLLEELGRSHMEAFDTSCVGWGRSSIEGARELKEAGSVRKLLALDRKRTRTDGNGIAMKIGPIAVWAALRGISMNDLIPLIVNFASITHPSQLGAASGIAQVFAVSYCLSVAPEKFSSDDFIETVVEGARHGEYHYEKVPSPDRLSERLEKLKTLDRLDVDDLVKLFGGGSSYVYNSLPFTYAFFLRSPLSIESLFDVINAGGDTDTNGAMLGTLLGALNGASLFPRTLIEGSEASTRAVTCARSLWEKLAPPAKSGVT